MFNLDDDIIKEIEEDELREMMRQGRRRFIWTSRVLPYGIPIGLVGAVVGVWQLGLRIPDFTTMRAIVIAYMMMVVGVLAAYVVGWAEWNQQVAIRRKQRRTQPGIRTHLAELRRSLGDIAPVIEATWSDTLPMVHDVDGVRLTIDDDRLAYQVDDVIRTFRIDDFGNVQELIDAFAADVARAIVSRRKH